MRPLKSLRSRAELIRELFAYLWAERLWWLVPLVLTLVIVGLFVAASTNPAVAPFVYTLF